jgi:site-specific DNA-methyltransferase (adenine-specific)
VQEPANDNALPTWKLIEGEALAELRRLASNSVDCIATDPPYSSGGLHLRARQQSTSDKYVMRTSGADHPSFSGDSRDQRSFAYWCQLWISECLRIAKPGATMLVFSDWRQLATTIDAVQAGGWTFTGIVPWDKTEGARPRMGQFRAQCEYVVTATKGQIDPEVAKGVGCLPGCFRFAVKKGDKFHQTGKPTALMEQLVRVCPVGGLVFDPFAGSGSTLVAAVNTGRRALGIELSPEYAEIAARRLDAIGEHQSSGDRCPTSADSGPTTDVDTTASTPNTHPAP